MSDGTGSIVDAAGDSGGTAGPLVSVVLPAYNEEDTIETTVERTLKQLGSLLPTGSFEVIVAEDGCEDRTPEIATRLAADDDHVRHFHSEQRLGRGGALEQAFSAADGDVLAYLDTDMATDMRHLEELIERVRTGANDIVTGSRWLPDSDADRPAERGIPSRAFNFLVRLVLRSELRDHQCGFKAMTREAFEDISPAIADEHWFWDTELLVRAQRGGYQVAEFPVEWTPEGDSTVDLVRDVLGMGSQIVRTWWQLSVRPRITRRVSIGAGLVLAVAALWLMTTYLDIGQVLAEMGRANRQLLGLATVIYLLSWPLRGGRYQDILSVLGYRERLSFLTGAVFISQTGNLVFPARAGDAVRAYVVKARRGIPYPSGFASLAVERVFDLLTIAGMAGVVLIGFAATGQLAALVRAVTGAEGAGRVAVLVATGVGLVAIAATIGIVLSAQSERNYVRATIRLFSDDAYADYVASIVERFVGDVQRVGGDPAAFSRVAVMSVLIWGLDVVTAVVVLAAFDVDLGLLTLVMVGFFAVSVGNLAKVLPLSPGGVGLYEGAFTLLVIGLTPVGYPVAIGAAVLDHAIKNTVTVIGGSAAMLALNVSLLQAVEESETREEATPTEVVRD